MATMKLAVARALTDAEHANVEEMRREKYCQSEKHDKYSSGEVAKPIPRTFPQKMGTSLWTTAPQPRQVLEIKPFSLTAHEARPPARPRLVVNLTPTSSSRAH
jgi:hypothetical protein